MKEEKERGKKRKRRTKGRGKGPSLVTPHQVFCAYSVSTGSL